MPDPLTPKPSPSAATPLPLLRLAVFHRSEEVQEHLAPLSQIKGIELVLIWQGTTWTTPRDVAGLLWELSPQDATDSRIAGVIDGLPAASYSPSVGGAAITEVSRTL